MRLALRELTWRAALLLPLLLPAAPGLSALPESLGQTEEFLPADQAFRVEVKTRDAETVVAEFTPAETYYLYRDKTAFEVKAPAEVAVASVDLPRGEVKNDPNFGETHVFHQPFQAVVRLDRPVSGRLTLAATFQGCSEKGLCYPPITKTFNLDLAAAEAAGSSAGPSAPDSESGRVAALFQGSFWLLILSFLGFGLLLAATPCVFPMFPILSGIIVGSRGELSKRRAFGLSAAYVMGMALTYALAGVAAGLSGALLSSALQNPWVLGSFAAVFVLLALSMFGLYELQLPKSLQSQLAERANHIRGGRALGIFAMGALSAVIVGPCVAAPLAGALLYIGQTRDVVLGGSALFAMALGMGAPLLVIGISAGALLPKAGPWMQAVERFFGVVLLAVAIWLVSPVLPVAVTMLAWAALAIVTGIYLHALDPLSEPLTGARKLGKGLGVILLLIGIAQLIGALSGSRDVLHPLAGLRAGSGVAEPASLSFRRVQSLAELESQLQAASGRPVMLDFYADWCVSCHEMERYTLSDPRVQKKLGSVVLLQADVTANRAEDAALLKRFGLFGPPGIIFFDATGREIPGARVVGYEPPEKFLASLERGLGG
jgi:thiol:disulfide interchange protein DsbD